MSNNDKNGFAITIGGTEMTLDIGKEDLLAVAVANYEQGLLAKKKDLTAQIRTLNNELTDLRKELSEGHADLAKGADDKKIQSFIRAAKRIGLVIEVETSWRHDGPNTRDTFMATRILQTKTTDSWNHSRVSAIHTIETKFDTPEDMRAKYDRAGEIETESREKGEELREVVMSLRNMSTKEREARAHLVVKGLQSTEEGRNLLTALAADGNPFMLTDGEQS